jgi:membrane protease YdiL (CAAX protease family)
MSAVAVRRPALSLVIATTLVAAGCAALVMRPFLRALTRDTTVPLLILFALLLLAGLLWPDPSKPPSQPQPWLVAVPAVVIGVGAFVVARALVPGQVAAPFGPRPLLLDGFAAVAEEAFFRRLVFAALLAAAARRAETDEASSHSARRFAIAGSAVLFAIVHVSVYGFGALPIDLAAGLLLSWQRDATGTWTVPAITHVIANALAVI